MNCAAAHPEQSAAATDAVAVHSASSRRSQDSRRPHAVLERSCKDLQRQTVSLERLRALLGDNVDKAFRRMNKVFQELHQQSVFSPVF